MGQSESAGCRPVGVVRGHGCSGASRSDWPGRSIGVRAPASGETALSAAEVLVAVKLGLVADDADELDAWPAVRRIRPAGTWGVFTPGLRRAGPFDGLTA